MTPTSARGGRHAADDIAKSSPTSRAPERDPTSSRKYAMMEHRSDDPQFWTYMQQEVDRLKQIVPVEDHPLAEDPRPHAKHITVPLPQLLLFKKHVPVDVTLWEGGVTLWLQSGSVLPTLKLWAQEAVDDDEARTKLQKYLFIDDTPWVQQFAEVLRMAKQDDSGRSEVDSETDAAFICAKYAKKLFLCNYDILIKNATHSDYDLMKLTVAAVLTAYLDLACKPDYGFFGKYLKSLLAQPMRADARSRLEGGYTIQPTPRFSPQGTGKIFTSSSPSELGVSSFLLAAPSTRKVYPAPPYGLDPFSDKERLALCVGYLTSTSGSRTLRAATADIDSGYLAEFVPGRCADEIEEYFCRSKAQWLASPDIDVEEEIDADTGGAFDWKQAYHEVGLAGVELDAGLEAYLTAAHQPSTEYTDDTAASLQPSASGKRKTLDDAPVSINKKLRHGTELQQHEAPQTAHSQGTAALGQHASSTHPASSTPRKSSRSHASLAVPDSSALGSPVYGTDDDGQDMFYVDTRGFDAPAPEVTSTALPPRFAERVGPSTRQHIDPIKTSRKASDVYRPSTTTATPKPSASKGWRPTLRPCDDAFTGEDGKARRAVLEGGIARMKKLNTSGPAPPKPRRSALPASRAASLAPKVKQAVSRRAVDRRVSARRPRQATETRPTMTADAFAKAPIVQMRYADLQNHIRQFNTAKQAHGKVQEALKELDAQLRNPMKAQKKQKGWKDAAMKVRIDFGEALFDTGEDLEDAQEKLRKEQLYWGALKAKHGLADHRGLEMKVAKVKAPVKTLTASDGVGAHEGTRVGPFIEEDIEPETSQSGYGASPPTEHAAYAADEQDGGEVEVSQDDVSDEPAEVAQEEAQTSSNGPARTKAMQNAAIQLRDDEILALQIENRQLREVLAASNTT